MKRISVSFLVLSLIFLLSPLTYAANSPSVPATNGYRLSPVRTDLNLKPGNSDTLTIFIQNASSAVENLQVVVNDFEAPTNETGYPSLLLNGATAPEHSLKQFVSIPVTTYNLKPNETKSVSVVVKVPDGAASGGYYGAVRFEPVGSGGSKNVNLSASVASLILLTVPGNLNERLSIVGFGVTKGDNSQTHSIFLSKNNLNAIVRFKNDGNVQEQPFGKIVLKKGNHILNTYQINNAQSPGNVLPSSIRRFSVNLDKLGSFGKYKVEGNFGYGSKGQLLPAQATFYIIPITIIAIALLLLIFIIFLIFILPKLIRSYNKRIIEKSRR